jgi:hypothetical protein
MIGIPKVGDQIKLHKGDVSTVLKVYPYTGKYPEYFSHVLRLSSTQTRSGYIETVIGEHNDYEKVGSQGD